MVDSLDPAVPWRAFSYLLDLGQGVEGGFEDVSGLVQAVAADELHEGEGLTRPQRPVRSGPVVLRRGIVLLGGVFVDWHRALQAYRTGVRPTITLSLNDARSTLATWQLLAADPIRVDYGDVTPDGAHVAIDCLEFECTVVRGSAA